MIKKEIEQIIRLEKERKIIQHEKQTDTNDQENYKFEREIKEIKEENVRKIHQIK